MLAHFTRFAAYNKWANDKLYDACDQLSDEEYFAKRQAFFGSIHGVLNHMMVGDTIWTSRLHGTSPVIALNAELYDRRDTLREARQKMDGDIIAYIDGLSEADIAGDVTYKTTSGDPFTSELSFILQHFFNHHAHHRGQAHDLLSQTSVEPPVLDLLYYARG
ncbi:MAG: DUF664 domain-containing protein [Alphaproteobacteria bacterium]|nr:DUF664 domain-containing protein [Alphaproteobacteria bacterium]